LIYIFINYLYLNMMTTAVILMSLVSTNCNVMTNMFDLNYLKTRERNKIQQFKKQQYENNHNLMIKTRTSIKRHNFNNFNITKER
jgi:hypothetical protein